MYLCGRKRARHTLTNDKRSNQKKIIFFSEKLVEIKKALIFAPRKRAENDKEKVQKIKGLKKFNFFSKRLVNKK